MATHDTNKKDSLFEKTPPAPDPTFQTGKECGVNTTSVSISSPMTHMITLEAR